MYIISFITFHYISTHHSNHYIYRPESSFNTTHYLNCDPTGRWAPCLPGEAPRGGAPLPAGAAQSDGAPGGGTAGGCPGGAALPATGRGMSAAGAALWPKTAAAGTTGRWMEKRLEKRYNVNPGLINHGLLIRGTPPIVIIWYLNGTLPIKQLRGLLIQGWHYTYVCIWGSWKLCEQKFGI